MSEKKRVVSLLAAATEIVCALGMEDVLVGISHECDYPESIKHLPVCSEAKFIPGSDSREIDRQVKEILSDALSVYSVNKELIKSLQPDIVITQNQCEVCAVSEKDVQEALKDLLDKDVEIISLSPHGLSDIFTDIKTVASSLAVPERAEALLEGFDERIDLIRHKLKFIDNKPEVACIEWIAPVMIAGNWTPEMVEIAGGKSGLAQAGKHSPFINFEDVVAKDPDIIIVMPCGFSIPRSLQELNLLLELPGWNELKAVKNNRIYVADGNHYFNRSGPRIVDSIEILAEIINPKMFNFGYEGEGWIKFDVS